MSLEPLHRNASALRTCIGAAVNIDNIHWVALRWCRERVWLLDSQEFAPQPLSWEAYLSFINQNRDAYRIEAAPDNAAGTARRPDTASQESQHAPLLLRTNAYVGMQEAPDPQLEEKVARELNSWMVRLRAENRYLYQIPIARVNAKAEELRERLRGGPS